MFCTSVQKNVMNTMEINQPIASGSSRINVGATERVASVFLGSFLLTSGLKRLFRHPILGVGTAFTGGALLYRGITGYCAVNNAIGRDSTGRPKALHIKESIRVNLPKQQVFTIWDQLENLPSFMHHLETVERLPGNRSRWVARAFDNVGKIEWFAETTSRREGEILKWRSVPGSMVDNAGEVIFIDAPEGNGTEVHATISYLPPAGDAGRLVAKLFSNVFEQMVRDDLHRFKSMIETGELRADDSVNPVTRSRIDIPVTG